MTTNAAPYNGATPSPDVSTGKTPPKSPSEWQREFPEGESEVVRWARIQCLSLPTGTHRWILIVLSYWANLEGWAEPSQDTIAEYTGYSRATVCSALLELELIGLLTSELRHDEEGYHKKYRLAMESHAEWPESPEATKRSIAQRLAESKQQQNDEITRLRSLLAEAGIDPDSPPASVNPDESFEGERQTGLQEGRREEEYPILENSSLLPSETVDQVSTELTPDTRKAEIGAWVEKNWDRIKVSAANPGGWRRDKAYVKTYYPDHLDRYEADRAGLEAEDANPGTPRRPMTAHERRIEYESQFPIRGKIQRFGYPEEDEDGGEPAE